MVAFYPTLPNTKSKRAERAWELGTYAVLLFTNVKALSGGDVYPFVLEVRGPFPESQGVAMYVVSEPGAPTNYLCAITDNGRANFGCSDDWKDKDKFVAQALQTAKNVLKVEETINEIAPPITPEGQNQKSPGVLLLSFLPIAIAFLVAPFDRVFGLHGIRTLYGWRFIFTAADESSRLQINITIWIVQIGISIAVAYLLARLAK